jgi:dTDP-4-amino-4,6-dideoxygalactose transaminase
MIKNVKKLAFFGGIKIRKNPMPTRFAFGKKENKEINKMLRYYRSKNEDPKYSGKWEDKFCKAFSKFMGGGYTDAVATGTGAIYVAMKALDIPKNSDVLICPVTCAGNFSCITEQNHNPVLIDSKKLSYNTSLAEIKKRITKRTKLIQLTHAAGEPVSDVAKIATFAKKKKIYLLEDCSQSIGATVGGRKVGTFGDISAFSTMYRKNLAANSSSGLVFTKNKKLFHKALAYADRGKILWNKNFDMRDPNHSLFPALNWNTDEFSCATGYANLSRLNSTNDRRKKFLKYLIKLMSKKKIISCKPYNYNNGFAPFYFPIFYDEKILKISKKRFTSLLIAEGIPLGAHYGCLVYDWKWSKKFMKDNFKSVNAIEARDNCFHLYLNENYSYKEANQIIEAIKKIENYYI